MTKVCLSFFKLIGVPSELPKVFSLADWPYGEARSFTTKDQALEHVQSYLRNCMCADNYERLLIVYPTDEGFIAQHLTAEQDGQLKSTSVLPNFEHIGPTEEIKDRLGGKDVVIIHNHTFIGTSTYSPPRQLSGVAKSHFPHLERLMMKVHNSGPDIHHAMNDLKEYGFKSLESVVVTPLASSSVVLSKSSLLHDPDTLTSRFKSIREAGVMGICDDLLSTPPRSVSRRPLPNQARHPRSLSSTRLGASPQKYASPLDKTTVHDVLDRFDQHIKSELARLGYRFTQSLVVVDDIGRESLRCYLDTPLCGA